MALDWFKKKKETAAHPPVATAAPDDPYRSPFTDQREDAADNWARPVQSDGQPTGSMSQPLPRQQAGGSWQTRGYHMEQTLADTVAPVDAGSDPGYITPEATDWHEDPFRDNGEDPELRKERSKEVENHSGPFFGDTGSSARVKTKTGQGRAGSRVGVYAALIVVVLLVIGTILYSTLLRITTITVEGCRTIPASEVVRLSGISVGDNVLDVINNDAAIKAGIESNSYLVFNSVKTVTPQQIIISVRERQPAAYINYCGIQYVIDNRGNVLSVSDETGRPAGLMRLEGVEIRSYTLGWPLTATNGYKLDLYKEIMLELIAMQMTSEVSELYLTDMENLYVGTTQGYSVHLGDSTDIHAKLRLMDMVVDELEANPSVKEGYSVGTIDVSNASLGYATFIPENHS